MDNEGGRELLLAEQALHKYNLSNSRSVIDTSPPKTYAQKPSAFRVKRNKKPINPDPSFIYDSIVKQATTTTTTKETSPKRLSALYSDLMKHSLRSSSISLIGGSPRKSARSPNSGRSSRQFSPSPKRSRTAVSSTMSMATPNGATPVKDQIDLDFENAFNPKHMNVEAVSPPPMRSTSAKYVRSKHRDSPFLSAQSATNSRPESSKNFEKKTKHQRATTDSDASRNDSSASNGMSAFSIFSNPSQAKTPRFYLTLDDDEKKLYDSFINLVISSQTSAHEVGIAMDEIKKCAMEKKLLMNYSGGSSENSKRKRAARMKRKQKMFEEQQQDGDGDDRGMMVTTQEEEEEPIQEPLQDINNDNGNDPYEVPDSIDNEIATNSVDPQFRTMPSGSDIDLLDDDALIETIENELKQIDKENNT